MKKSPLKIALSLVLGAVGLFIVFILITIGLALGVGSKPTQAAKTFTETVASGDITAAYDNLASDNFRANTTREEFDAFLTLNPVLASMSDVNFNGFEVSGGQALVYGTIEGAGETSPIRVLLENTEENGWLVSGIDFSEQVDDEAAEELEPEETSEDVE